MVIVSNEWVEYEEGKKSIMGTAGNYAVDRNDSESMKEWNNSLCNISGNTTPKCARAILQCQPNSHPFQTRVLLLELNSEIKVGRSIARSRVAENNAIFDCKVLSRNHAVLWYSDGKFFVKDTRSSNGTFINDRRIDQSEPEELNSGDIIKFGVDVIENSRQEVHGCIIACIKLFTPDGREYISNKLCRTKPEETNLSLDGLHRLHHFIQETVQREKVLEVRLHDIQNIIEVTRQNTGSCWNAMIDEDRLLNRIDILETKLHMFQKNSTEDKFKSEILRLQEDKFLYQKSAKEALRKVYQERMDAMQKLSTIERALCNSEDECSLLRDQVLKTQQNLQEVICRLQQLETEYKEKQSYCEKIHGEMEKEKSEEFSAKLKEKTEECEEYQKQISALTAEKIELQKLLEMQVQQAIDDDQIEADETSPIKSGFNKWLKSLSSENKEVSEHLVNAVYNEVSKHDELITKAEVEDLIKKMSACGKDTKTDSPVDDQKSEDEPDDSSSAIDISSITTSVEDNHELLDSITERLIQIHEEVLDFVSNIKLLREVGWTDDSFKELQEKINVNLKELSTLHKDIKNLPKSQESDAEVTAIEVTKLDSEVIIPAEEKPVIVEDDDEVTVTVTLNKKKSIEVTDSYDILPKNDNDSFDDDDDIRKSEIECMIHCEEELVAFKEKYEKLSSENLRLKVNVNQLEKQLKELEYKNLAKYLTFYVACTAVICYLLFLFF